MGDKQSDRLKKYYWLLLDMKEELVEDIEKITSNIAPHIQTLLHSPEHCPKDSLLQYENQAISCISNVKLSVLEFLNNHSLPELKPEPKTQTLQELNDYLKTAIHENFENFDFSTNDPKVSNIQVQNDSYVRKPLDNKFLKIICTNLTNNSSNIDKGIPSSDVACSNLPETQKTDDNVENQIELVSSQGQVNSPTFSSISDIDLGSTVSSVEFQHPLLKYQPSIVIPAQYDTEEIEAIRENLKNLQAKLGFDDNSIDLIKNDFHKALPSLNFEYEEPVKEVQTPQLVEVDVTKEHSEITEPEESTLDSTSTSSKDSSIDRKSSKTPEMLNNEVPTQNTIRPCAKTGAIRKVPQKDLIEFSTSDSDNSIRKTKESVSVIDKLGSRIRYDRNEKARVEALNTMSDLRLVPVELPKVIKNDLNGSPDEKKEKVREVKEMNNKNVFFELKKMEIPKVDAICIFSHVVSPSEFYLQVVNDFNTVHLDLVTAQLNEKFKGTSSQCRTKEEAFSKLGKYCLGYILEKKGWFRLQVLDWMLGSKTKDVEVQAVDFGYKYTLSYTYLREMVKEMADIPLLCIKSHLPMLYPPESTFSNRLTNWPDVTIEVLHNISGLSTTENDSDFKYFEIIFAMMDGDSLAVDMVQFDEGTAESLGKILVDWKLAVEILDDYEDNQELAECLEDINELERAENLNELILGYDARDEARICKFTRKDGTCYKGKNCKLDHVTLKDGYTTDKTPVFVMATNDLVFPKKGDKIQVLVTSYIDSCSYLVQMIRNPVKNEKSNIVMDRDMSDLIDAMNHPRKTSKYEMFKVYPAFGEMVIVFHYVSKLWVRAAVRDFKGNEMGDMVSFDVYSVDFGETFSVSLREVRVMREEFMHVPFQVIQIYLDNFQHKTGCNAKSAMTFFNRHVYFRNFEAYFMSSDVPFRVKLTTFKGREIGPTLIKEGFAEKRTVDFYMSEIVSERSKFNVE